MPIQILPTKSNAQARIGTHVLVHTCAHMQYARLHRPAARTCLNESVNM